MDEQAPWLVADANVFIRHPNLQELSLKNKLFTVPAVVKEIRDPQARARLAGIMGALKVEQPAKAQVDQVMRFAKETGDYVSLSTADIEVIALAAAKLIAKGKGELLKEKPEKAVNFRPDTLEEDDQEEDAEIEEEGSDENECDEKNKQENESEKTAEQNIVKQDETTQETNKDSNQVTNTSNKPETEESTQENTIQGDKNEVNEDEVSDDNVEDDDGFIFNGDPHKFSKPQPPKSKADNRNTVSTNQQAKASTTTQAKLWNEDKDFEKDDDEGWITQENLQTVLEGPGLEEGKHFTDIGVGLMSSDFAVQNIALQMGIPLLAVDGMMVTKVKSYILECFGCNTICRDNTKKFCPGCGHNTLLRVTCSFNDDGSFVLYRKKNYKVNLRGKRFAIPKPKGGKVNKDLILTEDQLNQDSLKRKMYRKEKYLQDQFQKAEQAYDCGFGFETVKKHNSHFGNYDVGYGRHNPNDNEFRKKRGKRR